MRFELAFLDELACISSHSIGTSKPERCPKDIEDQHFEAEILVTLLACFWMFELQLAEGMVIENVEEAIHGIAYDHANEAHQMTLEEPSNELNPFYVSCTPCHEIKHCNWNGYVHLDICAYDPASLVVVPEASRTVQNVVHDGVEDDKLVPQVEYQPIRHSQGLMQIQSKFRGLSNLVDLLPIYFK